MSNKITPFNFEGHTVRSAKGEDGEPLFNANDVCEALTFGNPYQAINSHVDVDDLQKLEVIDSLGRTQTANFVNESGMYALIFGSTKQEAKRFKRWVTHEVLPTIRKTGQYRLGADERKEVYDRLFTLPPFNDFRPEAILSDEEKARLLAMRRHWQQIYDLVLLGLTCEEIAEKLSIGRSTAHRHILRMRACRILPPLPRKAALELESKIKSR